MAVVGVHAAATQLDHAVAHDVQTGQIKLGIAVGAASALRLGGGQYAVGPHNLTSGHIFDQQMFTIVVECIDVVASHRGGQTGAHFRGEHRVAQALGFTHFIEVLGPGDLDRALAASGQKVHDVGP